MEQEAKKGLSVLTSALMSILVALIVGGTTWYVMDQKAKKADDTVGDLNKRVVELEKKKSEEAKAMVPPKSIKKEFSNETAGKNDIDEIKAICNQPRNADSQLKAIMHISNLNGDFARCSIGAKVGGGANIILKKIDNKWTQLWAGNGSMNDEDVVKYKIPNEIYPNNHGF